MSEMFKGNGGHRRSAKEAGNVATDGGNVIGMVKEDKTAVKERQQKTE